MAKKKALIVCPGRGTYNAAELGYLSKYHKDKEAFIAQLDAYRSERGQTPISELDGATKYKMGLHGTGDNASLLIFACSIADFQEAQKQYDIVAVTGNSMGWYLALTCGGALSTEAGAHLVNEMGTQMHEKGKGGQIVYPIVDDNWNIDADKLILVENVLSDASTRDDITVEVSINLGGMVVFAACDQGLKYLSEKLPAQDRFPMQLANHSAFHSSVLDHMVPIAQRNLGKDLFSKPSVPLIDGRGVIWSPHGTKVDDLYQYTLGHQINKTYEFTTAIDVGVKEFAPDVIIVTGPGTTMGAPVAQTLIQSQWKGMTGKDKFKEIQSENPFIISMGMEDQRQFVTGA